jgi:hypothetical protein
MNRDAAPSPLVGEGWGEGVFAIEILLNDIWDIHKKAHNGSSPKLAIVAYTPPLPNPLPRGEGGLNTA